MTGDKGDDENVQDSIASPSRLSIKFDGSTGGYLSLFEHHPGLL